MGHWLAEVHSAVFAPAFPFVALRQEIRPQTANAHSLSRYQQAEKKSETEQQQLDSNKLAVKKEKNKSTDNTI